MNSATDSSTPATGQVGRPGSAAPVDVTVHALPSSAHETTIAAGVAILIASLFGYEMYLFGTAITGPFIFGDELEYFLYGHDLFAGADLSNHTQYGILYPILLAVAFHFGDVANVYHGMRAFNVAVIASSVVPSFLHARALLAGNSLAWMLLSVFIATCSFTALADMIWADPLYFMLFQWLVYALFVFYRRPRISTGCVAGVLLGLLFHAKPGAGIVVEVAAFVSMVALLSGKARQPFQRSLIGSMLAIVLTCSTLTVPWLVRNLSLGVGPIGYADHTQELKSLIAAIGIVGVAKTIFWSLVLSAFLCIGRDLGIARRAGRRICPVEGFTPDAPRALTFPGGLRRRPNRALVVRNEERQRLRILDAVRAIPFGRVAGDRHCRRIPVAIGTAPATTREGIFDRCNRAAGRHRGLGEPIDRDRSSHHRRCA